MVAKRMWCLTIRIKKNDELKGKRLYKAILDYMMEAGISGATVVNAVDGFGRRGKSTLRIEGISINYPLVIEVVEEPDKLLPLLPDIKRMVDDNGMMTYQEVSML
jgi:PII-like signaling protein